MAQSIERTELRRAEGKGFFWKQKELSVFRILGTVVGGLKSYTGSIFPVEKNASFLDRHEIIDKNRERDPASDELLLPDLFADVPMSLEPRSYQA